MKKNMRLGLLSFLGIEGPIKAEGNRSLRLHSPSRGAVLKFLMNLSHVGRRHSFEARCLPLRSQKKCAWARGSKKNVS